MNTTIIAGTSGKAKWALPEPPKRRLRDDFADWMRAKNYARATIAAYVADVREFVLVSGKRDPREMGAPVERRIKSPLDAVEWDRRVERGKVGGGEGERNS